MSFRINAINISLTYPQCTSSKQNLYEHLLQLTHGTHKVSKLLIGQESHADGGIHFHCYLKWDSKPNIRDPRFFDFEGNHPNVSACRATSHWIKYCTKEDKEPFTNFDPGELESKSQRALKAIQQAIEEGKTATEAIDASLGVDPGLLRSIPSLQSYYHLKVVRSKVFLPLYEISSFSLTASDNGRMLGYQGLISNHRRGDRTHMRSLWIVGASRMGKTSLARSLGTHWYMNQNWNVDSIADEASYGIIDDVPWNILKWNYKAILGLQQDVSLTDKYRSKKIFKLGVPVIITTNTLPTFDPEESDWLRVNVNFLSVTSSVLPNNNPIPFQDLNI